MGKSSKDKDRRAIVEQMRRDQKRAEKRRTYAIIAACAAVGLVIIGLGAYPVIKDARTDAKLSGTALDSLGVPAAQAGCQDVQATPATGSADHKPDGERIFYEEAPPASGPHYASPAPFNRKFYTADDRPPLETLVHNLEHGYSILWYNETIAADPQKLADVEAIAKKFPSDSDPKNKFIVAPWTADDGKPFPDGTHIALTHWSMGGTNGNPEGQQGLHQFCAEPSGEVVAKFVEDYPHTDSPEPNAA